MYRILVSLIAIVLLYSCSGFNEGVQLKEGSPEYDFAKDLTRQLPSLNPDSNKILVKTNRFNITTGTVTEALYKNFYNKLDQLKKFSGIKLKNIYKENAELIAKKQMLLYAAEDADIEISEAEIDSALQVEFSKSGSKEEYIEYLSNNNITLDFVKEDFKNSLTIKKYLENAVASSATVTAEEIQEKMIKFTTATVRHILLKTKDKTESEKTQIKNKMKKILKLAKKGNDFAELAKKYSEDTGSRDNGGLYKNFNRGDMVKSFEDVAFSIPIGEISDIFETPIGYHILKVLDRKKDSRSAKEIKSDLKKMKQDQSMPKHIVQLKKQFEFTIMEF